MKARNVSDQQQFRNAVKSAGVFHRAVVGHVVSAREGWIYDYVYDPPAITAAQPAMFLHRANAIFGPSTIIQLQNGPEILVAGSVLFK